MISFRIFISPFMEGIRTSNLRRRYIHLLKNIHRTLHLRMEGSYYLIIARVSQIFISSVTEGLQFLNLNIKYTALIGILKVLLQRR